MSSTPLIWFSIGGRVGSELLAAELERKIFRRIQSVSPLPLLGRPEQWLQRSCRSAWLSTITTSRGTTEDIKQLWLDIEGRWYLGWLLLYLVLLELIDGALKKNLNQADERLDTGTLSTFAWPRLRRSLVDISVQRSRRTPSWVWEPCLDVGYVVWSPVWSGPGRKIFSRPWGSVWGTWPSSTS